jgi:hypothetical protein
MCRGLGFRGSSKVLLIEFGRILFGYGLKVSTGMYSEIGQRCEGLNQFGGSEADCSRNLLKVLLRSIEDKLRFSWSSRCAFAVGLVQC